MAEVKRDRRRIPSDLRTRPPESPVNILILVVIGVLAVSAIAAALLGGGHEETTPHGQVLTSLQRLSDAQEAYHEAQGHFAEWTHTLDVEAAGDVRITVIRGDAAEWEATAVHPAGIMCIQTGTFSQGRAVRDPPVCYTMPPDPEPADN
jgi:hypothetical protein